MHLGFLALALVLVGTAAAACTEPRMRKSWSALSDDEKVAYLDADLCLMRTPVPTRLANSRSLANATTLYEALQAAHFAQVHYVHRNGAFLAWHRFYLSVHEWLLRSECDYLGPMPYWDEQADERTGLANASIWHPVLGFGSYNKTDANHCIVDGPFANSTVSLTIDFTRSHPMCITINPSPGALKGASQDIVDRCDALDDFVDFNHCYSENGPHGSGHGAVGGSMIDPARSPGHPLFFLHHGNLDRLWWNYQKKDLPRRLENIGDKVVSAGSYGFENIQPKVIPPESMLPYIGDPGNVTTLDHVLWMVDIVPNVTIGDVMDLSGDTICADYE